MLGRVFRRDRGRPRTTLLGMHMEEKKWGAAKEEREGTLGVAAGVLDAWGRSGTGCCTEVRQHLTRGHGTSDQVEGSTGELQTLKLYFWYLRE